MKRREYLSPDITPLIDIVFLLIVFFLVSSVLKKDEIPLNISLPKIEGKETQIEQKIITVSFKDDTITINKKIVKEEHFLKELRKFDSKSFIHLYIDKATSYQKVMQLLALLKQAGFYQFTLTGMKK
jgi:biopolymer transport protein ExbD